MQIIIDNIKEFEEIAEKMGYIHRDSSKAVIAKLRLILKGK